MAAMAMCDCGNTVCVRLSPSSPPSSPPLSSVGAGGGSRGPAVSAGEGAGAGGANASGAAAGTGVDLGAGGADASTAGGEEWKKCCACRRLPMLDGCFACLHFVKDSVDKKRIQVGKQSSQSSLTLFSLGGTDVPPPPLP
eukprot:3348145-Rhodomonas_salina.1